MKFEEARQQVDHRRVVFYLVIAICADHIISCRGVAIRISKRSVHTDKIMVPGVFEVPVSISEREHPSEWIISLIYNGNPCICSWHKNCVE